MQDKPRKGRLGKLVLVIIVIGLIAAATNEIVHSFRHVYEPNARVEANFTILSSSVNGNIAAIHVSKGDRVNAGDKLASMESDVAALDAKSLEADLDRERAVRTQTEQELKHFLAELEDKMSTREASIEQMRRELSTLQERQAIASSSLERNNKLLNQSAVSRQRTDETQDKLLDITSDIRALHTQIVAKDSEIRELLGRKRRDSVFRSRLDVIDRNIDKLQVLLAQSRQRLKEMDIYSPTNGIVNDIYVQPGAYVEDGDQAFLLHEPAMLWIEADINESDIRHVRVGQRVVVELDAYPFEHFDGVVKLIGHVTKSNSANLGRNSDASKSEQRIPIVVDFPPIGKSVWPGMRASVNIVIR